MHRPPPIQASSLVVRLGSRTIIDHIDLEVTAGRWLGILGPNGSGKTTLLRALSGLIPHEGALLLDGRPLADWPIRERARRIAFVRQQLGLAFDFSVNELVLLGRAPHKPWLAGYNRVDQEQANEALERVDLAGFGDRSMLALSGGEQRRVLLAQALVQNAELLLLDEPTTYLDVNHRYQFLNHIRSLVDQGHTTVGVFHDLELAARYSDDLAVLQDGRIVRFGSPSEVLEPGLIGEVFGMEAEVVRGAGDHLQITFGSPISSHRRNGERVQA